MVRVWDAGLNAWRDAKTIRRYDQERQAFVDVEAVYTTINGVKRQVWPNKLYLYKAGDECVAVTGGWKAYTYTHSGWSSGTPTAPNLTKGASSMSASLTVNKAGAVGISKPISLSGYSKLCALVSGNTPQYCHVSLQIGTAINNSDNAVKGAVAIGQNEVITDKTVIMDITQIDRSLYVYFQLVSQCNLTVKQVWLEK